MIEGYTDGSCLRQRQPSARGQPFLVLSSTLRGQARRARRGLLIAHLRQTSIRSL